jgi:SAM-dependent methyltransferase
VAERYLGSFADDTAGAVSFLKELAGDGPALELGIGTGRVALPLAEAGTEVHGIDASEAMLAKLKAKPGSDRISVRVGSFADFSLETRFRLVYVVFNTFFGLLTQDDQVSSFQAVARHLDNDGVFAMQAFVPDVTRFDAHNQRVAAESVGIDEVTWRPPVTTRSELEARLDQLRAAGVAASEPLPIGVIDGDLVGGRRAVLVSNLDREPVPRFVLRRHFDCRHAAMILLAPSSISDPRTISSNSRLSAALIAWSSRMRCR